MACIVAAQLGRLCTACPARWATWPNPHWRAAHFPSLMHAQPRGCASTGRQTARSPPHPLLPVPHHAGSILSVYNTGGHGRGGQAGRIVGDVINHGKHDRWGKPVSMGRLRDKSWLPRLAGAAGS